MEFGLYYPDGRGGVINMGQCGSRDLGFLHAWAIKWPELTNMISKAQERLQRMRCADAYPHPTAPTPGASGTPYPQNCNPGGVPDQGQQTPEDE